MTGYRLYKKEKLCSKSAIDKLFSQEEGLSAIAYPLRVVWRVNDSAAGVSQFLITVPKRRLHHAVERVLMRRRIREAFRLHRDILTGSETSPVQMAFVYVSDKILPYRTIEKSMMKLLKTVSEKTVC